MVKFIFGRVFSSSDGGISNEQFYCDVANYVVDASYEGAIDIEFVSIPVNHGDRRWDIFTKIHNVFQSKEDERTRIFIVDAFADASHTELAGIKRLDECIQKAVEGQDRFKKDTGDFCIYLPKRLPDVWDSSVHQGFMDLAKKSRFAAISEDGSVIGKDRISSDFDSIFHRHSAIEHFGYSRQDIERKIIERVGIFSISGVEGTKIVSHFFDCTMCVPEISYVAKDWILKKISENGLALDACRVIIADVGSSWIEQVGFKLQEILIETCPDLACCRYSSEEPQSSEETSDVFLLLPFVETGGTANFFHQVARSCAPIARVHSLAVLTTRADQGPSVGGYASLDGGAVEFEYLVGVKSRRNLHKGLDLVSFSKGRASPTNVPIETKGKLSASQFWMMVAEAGVEQESVVPSSRDPLGFLPNWRSMISSNRSLIGAEIAALLRADYSTSNKVVVAPLEETAAPLICQTLLDLFGIESILIPRSALDDAKDSSEDTLEGLLEEKYSGMDWWKKLSEWSSEDKGEFLYIIDEIFVSGGTGAAISKIIRSFSIKVRAQVVVANFSFMNNSNKPNSVQYLYGVDYSVLGV